MKDKRVAKYMKKLAKSVYHDIQTNFPKNQFLEPYQEEDLNDLLLTLQSCKQLFKWHTTRDRWHEVDKFEVRITFLQDLGDFDL